MLMDDINILKAELDDPKNAFVISKLEEEMHGYVARKRAEILKHHQKMYGSKADEAAYVHSIIQYFAFVDRCCMSADTEIRIQLGRAMRDTLAKLKRKEQISIDDFVTAFLKEKSISALTGSFAEHAQAIFDYFKTHAEEWREDYMVTIALLFDKKKDEYVNLLLRHPTQSSL
jgi:hypothetical protein